MVGRLLVSRLALQVAGACKLTRPCADLRHFYGRKACLQVPGLREGVLLEIVAIEDESLEDRVLCLKLADHTCKPGPVPSLLVERWLCLNCLWMFRFEEQGEYLCSVLLYLRELLQSIHQHDYVLLGYRVVLGE